MEYKLHLNLNYFFISLFFTWRVCLLKQGTVTQEGLGAEAATGGPGLGSLGRQRKGALEVDSWGQLRMSCCHSLLPWLYVTGVLQSLGGARLRGKGAVMLLAGTAH